MNIPHGGLLGIGSHQPLFPLVPPESETAKQT